MAGAEFHDGALESKGLALVTFLYLYDAIRRVAGGDSLTPGAVVDVTSTLPIGAGLGSSAAYCVSLAAALLYAFGHIQQRESKEMCFLQFFSIY